jgi:hypothetical protein
LSLSRKSLGSQEMGTLKTSLDTVRGEVEAMAKQHQGVAAQMKSELEEPLAAFAGALKERRKIVQNAVERLLKTKVQQTQLVNKVSASGSCTRGLLLTATDTRPLRAGMPQDQGLSRPGPHGHGPGREKE